jgi:hypothetical protein
LRENKLDKEEVKLLGRCGIKYIDKYGTEYFIDGEMVVNINYDFALYSVELYEEYINKYDSSVSKEKTYEIINRVIELYSNKIRMKYIPPKI